MSSLVSSSFPLLFCWIWPLSVWPLKSEKTERDCPGLKGSFSQFTPIEHTHTHTHTHAHTHTRTHMKRVSNKHLYQEFKNKEASAPCVAAHPRLNTHTHTHTHTHIHTHRRNVLERQSQTQKMPTPSYTHSTIT